MRFMVLDLLEMSFLKHGTPREQIRTEAESGWEFRPRFAFSRMTCTRLRLADSTLKLNLFLNWGWNTEYFDLFWTEKTC